MRFTGGLLAAALAASLLPRVATAAPARLTPANLVLDLEAGQSKTTHYRLTLDAQPLPPTDLYLLVDTSASTQPYLADLRRGLRDAIAPLAARGVFVGVGEFRTTSLADRHDELTYRALRKVAPVDSAVVQALDRLGRDQPRLPQVLPGHHAHPVALDQAVTGAGHPPYARQGHDAGFRPAARKVVAVITAAPFAADSSQPSRSEAIAALRARGAEVFGLALDDSALSDLTAVASGTGSVTETTVDCGTGGRIPPGRPTACVMAPRAVSGTLAEMLYERRRGVVTVSVKGTGVRRLTPRTFSVDLNAPSKSMLRLEVGCAAGDAGRTHQVGLSAALAGKVVARASLTAYCRTR